jgi:hypothetical protein
LGVTVCSSEGGVDNGGDVWQRGAYGNLTFSVDCSSATFVFGGTELSSTHPKPASCSATSGNPVPTTAVGGGRRGLSHLPGNPTFDELVLSFEDDGELYVRYFAADDAFVFGRTPKTVALPALWPTFATSSPNTTDTASPAANRTACLGWDEKYFFPGSMLSGDLAGCNSGGPLLLFERPAAGAGRATPTLAVSPLSHFSSTKVVTTKPPGQQSLGVDAGALVSCRHHCLLFPNQALLLARPGLVRAGRAVGAALRRAHNTTRSRGPGVTALSYWNDNQAGYSWWSSDPDQYKTWGLPEDIYLKLKDRFDAHGIPVRSWEPDNNFQIDYKPPWGDGPTEYKWATKDWKNFNSTLYPSGGGGFVSKLGNLSMAYYTNGFAHDNVHQKDWKMVGSTYMEPHPNVSLGFHRDIYGNAAARFGMEMVFFDYLQLRGKMMAQFQDVDADEDGEHKWLAGSAVAAAENGAEMQFCMAWAHHILSSVEWPAVTNARVNGDGGSDTGTLILSSMLAGMVGLGWSKDNLHTAGPVSWTSSQQTMLAALSMGPVGLSDRLTTVPTDPTAEITTNKSLVMATCTANGTLLTGSYPLSPVDRMLTGTAATAGDGFETCGAVVSHGKWEWDCGVHLWATYTTVLVATAALPATPAATAGYWFTAIAYRPDRTGFTITILESDMAVMVDAAGCSEGDTGVIDLANVPCGTFLGTGSSFPTHDAASGGRGVVGYVAWTSDSTMFGPTTAIADMEAGCPGVTVSVWGGAFNASLPAAADSSLGFTQLNIAPYFVQQDGTKLALLGELSKLAAVSTYRFASVRPTSVALEVDLRGEPGEHVTLLFAAGVKGGGEVSPPLVCSAHSVTLGSDGTATATYPSTRR